MVSPAVRDMTGVAALPRLNGELVFEAPWQGRVFGLAIGLVESLGLPWAVFQAHLIDAIAADPDRPYYESWVAALEALAEDQGIASASVEAAVHEPGMGELELFPLPTDQDTLFSLITGLFRDWWPSIRYGPMIQGAVWEGRATGPPASIDLLDGYVTVDTGEWHFHVCIGEHTGHPGNGVDPDVARVRRCARAELYRVLHDDAPVSWGFRMFNGADEQQMTVLLPNPFLDDDQQVLDAPDWSRLSCWDRLRACYLGLPPDPRDRTADRFHHG